MSGGWRGYFRLMWLPFVALWGCSQERPRDFAKPVASGAPQQVRVLVVDDPAISAAIAELRAEWKARTGATLEISEATSDELLKAETVPAGADAVIYPSGLIGTLAAREWIVPLPADYASQKELAWSDTFELLQLVETRWNGAPHAVTLGSPVLVCYVRGDLLESLRKNPPRTWSELHELAQLLNKREVFGSAAPAADRPWHGCVQPLAPGWAWRVLLSRAAAYAKHADHYSDLFRIDTMEPLVAGPPFVRALEELVADARLGPENPLELDGDAARQIFLRGEAALAITWPGHATTSDPNAQKPPPTTFAELPGSMQVFNIAAGAWENRPRDDESGGRVTTLALAGRLGSITRQASDAGHVLSLLAWLSGSEWGARVSGASPATTLYRRSQMAKPQPWLDPLTDVTAAQQYAATLRDALDRTTSWPAPRIAGREQYLQALDAAVAQAVRGEKTAAEALAAAAARWQEITATLGIDAQRKAYRQNLGLDAR